MKITLPDWLKLIAGSIDDDNDDASVDMMLMDSIGVNPQDGTGISAKQFGQVLSSIPKKKQVNLLINSLGGRVDEGIAMHNMIAARGNVHTHVVGYAASMGSVIAQAGVQRKMMPGTMMIIHNPHADLQGADYRDTAQASADLKQLRDNLVDVYQARTKAGKKKIAEMMDACTMMTPSEAKDLGFCDEVVTGPDAYNSIDKPTAGQIAATCNILRSLNAPVNRASSIEQTKPMKSTLLILAKHKLIPTADITDDAVVAASVDSAATTHASVVAERDSLKAANQKLVDAQKTRVTSRVDKAITDKIVKAERKDSLVAMGLRDETELDNCLSDLIEARGTTAVTRRGAPSVPVKGDEKDSVEDQIKSLQAQMGEASSAEKASLVRQCQKLRGQENMFTASAETNK